MNVTTPCRRSGITLLEVLIAIGILAIGLSSIVAVMPAAHSQANRAVILDRAALLASNVLADAVTFGLTRPDGSTLSATATASTPILIDPAASAGYLKTISGNVPLPLALAGGAVAPTPFTAAPAAVLRAITELRDDVVFENSTVADAPPLNTFADGARSFQGRTTCVLGITPNSTPGLPGTLSVVVFHARDTGNPLAVTGTLTNLAVAQASLSTVELAGRRMRDVVKPGVVFWDPVGLRFHQAVATSYDMGGTTAYLTLSSGAALASGTSTVQFLPDSVGIAERPFMPESISEFTQ